MSCVVFAVAFVTDLDPAEVISALRVAQDQYPDFNIATAEGAAAALRALGFRVYEHQKTDSGAFRFPVRAWAVLSRHRYPGEPLLLFTDDHCMVAQDGRVFDTLRPEGPPGAEHPERRVIVEHVYRVALR